MTARVRRWWRSRTAADHEPDAGSAVVEFVVVGVLLLVPVVYLVVSLARVQAAAFAVEGGAREAARAFARAPDEATGAARAEAAVRLGLEDQGFTGVPDPLVLTCERDPCLQPEARVVAVVQVEVPLPGLPALPGSSRPLAVPVNAQHVAVVDRFRGGSVP